jgi:hypothetical protein
VHNKFLSEDRKFNEHFTAKQLTRWKYKVVAAFYLNSFLFRPGRVFRILWNFAARQGDVEDGVVPAGDAAQVPAAQAGSRRRRCGRRRTTAGSPRRAEPQPRFCASSSVMRSS